MAPNSSALPGWKNGAILAIMKATRCSKAGLVTLVERHSGFLLTARLPTITATTMAKAMIRLPTPRRGAVHTITLDSGSEFAEHREVAKAVSETTYFCDPYRSYQRGTNESTNGLIRQYFRKGADFRKGANAELRHIVNKLNVRPKKRLDIESQPRCS